MLEETGVRHNAVKESSVDIKEVHAMSFRSPATIVVSNSWPKSDDKHLRSEYGRMFMNTQCSKSVLCGFDSSDFFLHTNVP